MSESIPEFAAFVAIDWADKKHVWALRVAGSGPVEKGELDNTPEAVESWAAQWALRFSGRAVAVALEQRRGALVAMLSKYAHVVLYPIHPNTQANYRKAFYPSGAKSDPTDAALLLELLVKHRDRLPPLKPESEETRKLQFLVEERRKLVDQKTAFSNQLTGWAKQVFPQLLVWFEDISSVLVCELLQKWPTLAQLKKVRPATLEKFFREHNCRPLERIQQTVQAIQPAVVATTDPALLEVAQLAMLSLVGLITELRHSLSVYDKRLATISQAHPDFAIFDSFPAAGPVMLPRLIAACGTDRQRYPTAVHLPCHSGIAPVTESSGQPQWVHWRWACPKFVRQSFQEWSHLTIRFCGWAKEFYDRKRQAGLGHHAAVRALAFKWQRILFRCWMDRQPYLESRYLEALAKSSRRQAAPSAGSAQRPKIVMKSCGSFTKLEGLTS
jgi:hypothetical protein